MSTVQSAGASASANRKMRPLRSGIHSPLAAAEFPMRLRYGFNETDNWWHFAQGKARREIWRRLRELQTHVIRIFLFDKHAPDPVGEWDLLRGYIQAVLEAGAKPMITFSRFGPPTDNPRALRIYSTRCADVVWSCIEEWGGETVREWYWCVWNEPNNADVGGGLSFASYRHIYEEVAHGIRRWLEPYLDGRRARIGGPSIDSFQYGWWDWIWQFLSDIDESLVGFVSWHRYGDWRPSGESGSPGDDNIYRDLLMAQTPDYGARAWGIRQMLKGRDVLNVCGELNVHSHHHSHVSERFNRTIFGATYYVSALFHLMRGGADIEMWWTATEDAGPYGLIERDGTPTPVYHAKRLCGEHVRFGDRIFFPGFAQDSRDLDVIVSRAADGRRTVVLAHLNNSRRSFVLPDELEVPAGPGLCKKIDEGTGNRIVARPFDGIVEFDGYGVAVVTTE